MSTKKFILKNKDIEGLARWLERIELRGGESRIRTWFVLILYDYLKELEAKRMEIILKYVKRDSEGDPEIILDSAGKKMYNADEENKSKINAEYNEIISKDFIHEFSKEDLDKLEILKKIILDTDYKFGMKEGESDLKNSLNLKLSYDYLVWAEAFEKV